MAAAGGVVAALVMSLVMTGKMDVTMAMNGAIAGLVAITADPLSPSAGFSCSCRSNWWNYCLLLNFIPRKIRN